MKEILIFSDGASKGNPGRGGWGVIVYVDAMVTELGGRHTQTTNNRMELTAVVQALQFLSSGVAVLKGRNVLIYTDSRYVIQGATIWLSRWKKRGWKTAEKKAVRNQDMWVALDEAIANLDVHGAVCDWKYVGGHVGIPGNERVDEIASVFAQGKTPDLFSGPYQAYTVDLFTISFNVTEKEKKTERKARSTARAYSYISKVDGIIQTHSDWASCEARVKGVPGALFKKALNAAEEREIIDEFGRL